MISELMKRVAKCAPEELKLTYHEPSSRLVFNGNWGLCIDSDGSTVQNASGLMVLIEAMRACEERLWENWSYTKCNEDLEAYRRVNLILDGITVDNLNTKNILQCTREVFEQ